ncbi:hypothetical protein [Streptomyces sp. AC495_CC817]|nr:hypothetical protein [Streptomyces sp. AC495_CC817]
MSLGIVIVFSPEMDVLHPATKYVLEHLDIGRTLDISQIWT